MLNGRKPNDKVRLDPVVDKLLVEMQEHDTDSTEFASNLAYLERVYALRGTHKRWSVSADQMILVAGNLLGIMIIVLVEQKQPFTSKAQNFVLKTK